MQGEYWPIMWQLEDALRVSIWQCNNVNDKKTNIETLRDRIQIAVSYVLNFDIIVTSLTLNIIHAEKIFAGFYFDLNIF